MVPFTGKGCGPMSLCYQQVLSAVFPAWVDPVMLICGNNSSNNNIYLYQKELRDKVIH